MSKKAFKKVTKTLSKFDLGHKLVKQMGLPDPSGDLLYGKNKTLSPAEQAQKQGLDMAKQQAEQADRQMQAQLDAANMSAQQMAQQTANMSERDRLAAEVAQAGQVQNDRPTVQLAEEDPTTTTRRKFRSQVGGQAKTRSIRV